MAGNLKTLGHVRVIDLHTIELQLPRSSPNLPLNASVQQYYSSYTKTTSQSSIISIRNETHRFIIYIICTYNSSSLKEQNKMICKVDTIL
jgi:hypothetical protein